MQRGTRYERLPTDEENDNMQSIEQPANSTPMPENAPEPQPSTVAPPAYTPPDNEERTEPTEQLPATETLETDGPPAYNVASKLPSYEEAERSKMQEAMLNSMGLANTDLAIGELELVEGDEMLGTDMIFLCAFLVSFLFNWIGFLFALCVTQSIAGRYGALSGFGLSLVKWTVIVKHSTNLMTENDWLWWLMMVFGFMVFFRGSIMYLRVKSQWRSLTYQARQRLLSFYY